jgi:hypothetical protein
MTCLCCCSTARDVRKQCLLPSSLSVIIVERRRRRMSAPCNSLATFLDKTYTPLNPCSETQHFAFRLDSFILRELSPINVNVCHTLRYSLSMHDGKPKPANACAHTHNKILRARAHCACPYLQQQESNSIGGAQRNYGSRLGSLGGPAWCSLRQVFE